MTAGPVLVLVTIGRQVDAPQRRGLGVTNNGFQTTSCLASTRRQAQNEDLPVPHRRRVARLGLDPGMERARVRLVTAAQPRLLMLLYGSCESSAVRAQR